MKCNLISQSPFEGTKRDYQKAERGSNLRDKPSNDQRYVFFHVPHDGHTFPAELMSSVCITREDFMNYHQMMRDIDARRMIPEEYLDQAECFAVSRLLCDVERFIGPQEIMERYGMGFCYEKAYDGKTIKHVDEVLKLATREYYDIHHKKLCSVCNEHSNVMFFDLHSYSDSLIQSHAMMRNTPDLCIGTDANFTPPILREIIYKRFGEAGFSIAENAPYDGLYVPENVLYGQCDCDFIGVMLEFNKRCYCDSNERSINKRLELIRSTIRRVIADYEQIHASR